MHELVKPDGSQQAEKFCPYLPPVPVMSKMVPGRLDGFIFTDCQGEKCRIYDSCQGKYSMKARAEKSDRSILGVLKALRSFPLIPESAKSAIDDAMALLTDPQASA